MRSTSKHQPVYPFNINFLANRDLTDLCVIFISVKDQIAHSQNQFKLFKALFWWQNILKRGRQLPLGGFNPFEKYLSKMRSSKKFSRVEYFKKPLKPPPYTLLL